MLRGSSKKTRDDTDIERAPLMGPINEPEDFLTGNEQDDLIATLQQNQLPLSPRRALRSRSKSQDDLPDHTSAAGSTSQQQQQQQQQQQPQSTVYLTVPGMHSGKRTQQSAATGTPAINLAQDAQLRVAAASGPGIGLGPVPPRRQRQWQQQQQQQQPKTGNVIDASHPGVGVDDDSDVDRLELDDDDRAHSNSNSNNSNDSSSKGGAVSDWTRRLWQDAATRQHLTHIERMTTSPFVKYRKHRRIPWKFILNICVVIVTTALFAVRNVQYSAFVDNTSDSIRHLLGNPVDESMLSGATALYSADEVVDHMQGTMSAYFTFNETAAAPYRVLPTVQLAIANHTAVAWHTITPDRPLGPLQDLTALERAVLLQHTRKIKVLFEFFNEQREYRRHHQIMDVDFHWRCVGTYDLSVGGGRVHYSVGISSEIKNASRSEGW